MNVETANKIKSSMKGDLLPEQFKKLEAIYTTNAIESLNFSLR